VTGQQTLMTSWLIPANTKFYDVFSAFAEDETFWPKSAKINSGDTVYIYLVAPYKQIGFVCKVMETGFELDDVYEQVSKFFKQPPKAGGKPKQFMKLRTLSGFDLVDHHALSLQNMRANGLSGMLMGARKLENNPQLLGYIHEVCR